MTKFRINLIDIAFLALLVALLAIGLRFAAPQSVAAKPGDTTIRYTVELYRKDPDFAPNVQVGDKVYDTLKGDQIGTIVEVYTAPYKEEAPDFASGTLKQAQIGDLLYVYAVIEAPAQITESSTDVGRFQVLVGKGMFIRTKNFASSAYIVKLEKLS